MFLSNFSLILTVVWTFASGATTFRPSTTRQMCSCWTDFVPSCGVNGVTYDNYCHAECANVTVAYDGKCKANGANGLKTCHSCKKEYDPVCGIDGTTYSTQCLAKCAGATVAFAGPCFNATGECLGGCKEKRPAPVCGGNGVTYISQCASQCSGVESTQPGACRILPPTSAESCFCNLDRIGREEAICAADRRTYSNVCFANCAGVKVVYQGECQNVPWPSAARNNWMRWASYTVCGLDGRTYPNLCQAKCAGTGVSFQGSCSPIT